MGNETFCAGVFTSQKVSFFEDNSGLFWEFWRLPYAAKTFFQALSNNNVSLLLFSFFFAFEGIPFIILSLAGGCPVATCTFVDTLKVLIVVVVACVVRAEQMRRREGRDAIFVLFFDVSTETDLKSRDFFYFFCNVQKNFRVNGLVFGNGF